MGAAGPENALIGSDRPEMKLQEEPSVGMPPGVTRSFEAAPLIKIQLLLPAFPCLLPARRARLPLRSAKLRCCRRVGRDPCRWEMYPSWWQSAPLEGDGTGDTWHALALTVALQRMYCDPHSVSENECLFMGQMCAMVLLGLFHAGITGMV